jgi:hypothetical protein
VRDGLADHQGQILRGRNRQVNESHGDGGCSRESLLKNRLSDNVGGVKQFSSTPQHALVEERHFALVEAVAFALPTQARS